MVTHTINREHPEKFLTSTVQTHLFRPLAEDGSEGQATYLLSLRERSRQEFLDILRSGEDSGLEYDASTPKDWLAVSVNGERPLSSCTTDSQFPPPVRPLPFSPFHWASALEPAAGAGASSTPSLL